MVLMGKTTIGKLDTKVIFARAVTTSDNMGGYTKYYASQLPIWANVKEKPINREFGDKYVNYKRKVIVTIRLNTDIQDDWILRRNDEEWTIENIYSDEKHTYVECLI